MSDLPSIFDAAARQREFNQLVQAVENGATKVVRELLEAGVDPNYAGGESPLVITARKGYPFTAEILLEHGAAINERSSLNGDTALMTAAACNKPRMVRLLIEKGADLWLADKEGKTARDIALECGHEAVLKVFDDEAPAIQERIVREREEAVQGAMHQKAMARQQQLKRQAPKITFK